MSSPIPTPLAASGVDERTVFQALFTAYPDALIVADAGGLIVMANPAATALLGYAVDELVGLPVDALVPDAIRPRHAGYRTQYARNPRPRPMGTQMDLVARRRDGSEVMVEIALSPLQSDRLPLVVAAIRDIGTYPRVKQALQRARYSGHLAQLGRLAVDARDLQGLLEQVPAIAAAALDVEVAMVFLLEPDRLAFRLAASEGPTHAPPAGQLLNLPDTPVGFVLAQMKPVVVSNYHEERRFVVPSSYLDAAMVSGLAVPLSNRGRAVGVLSVCSRQARHFGDDEVGFLESLSNLLATSLQRAEFEEALNHAQRLESVGQLTGGIAHDFNNLLTVILGNLQVLEELPALVDDEAGQRLVGAATRASRRGAELTSKLLAFSRRQLLRPSAVDVRQLLGSLADMLRRTLDQRIRIVVDVPADCPSVLVDAGQLESALLNIAINARDAMPDGGTLRFQATACNDPPADVRHELELHGAAAAGFVAIVIGDTGIGMPEEVRERVFEPFFTTKEAGRGTGLGLSTVYGFIKQSKGGITVESMPGAGTTLTLYIPRSTDARSSSPEDADAEHEVPTGLSVLLVEDDAEVRTVVHGFLDAARCRVTTAASAEQALLELGAGTGPYDLLLTDIALGVGMRGTELAAEVRKRFPEMAVLLMSGFSEELLDADRSSPHDWELLHKPYGRDELTRAIARVIRQA